MLPGVFIDGEAGTTGLQIAQRLRSRQDLNLLSIDPGMRKDAAARAELMNRADVVILCLPDEAARLAVSLVTNPNTVIIDASTAHRTSSGWVYGFAEMDRGQRAALAAARRIANPGCYPTGFIGLVRPLVKTGLLPADWPVGVHAVSGYSGGGRAMIEEFESFQTSDNFRIYALGQQHKHLAEMKAFTGLVHAPMFTPSVGRFAQGMIVEVVLPLNRLPSAPRRHDVHGVLEQAYTNERAVTVASLAQCDATSSLGAEGCNDTNRLELYVFGNDAQVRLVARLDNLGKGAAGAAVQNLNIALGLDEAEGLVF